MTALNFPASPSVGQTYTFNNRTWLWDGTTWQQSVGTAASGMMKIGQVVCVGGETTITFANIPQNFSDLRLVYEGRDTNAGTTLYGQWLQLNGDATSGNYTSEQYEDGFGSSAAVGTDAASSSGSFAGLLASSNLAGATSTSDILIPNYAATVRNKTVKFVSTAYYNGPLTRVRAGFFVYLSSAAVTKLVLTAPGTAFAAGTTATLYGLGGNSTQSSPAVYEGTSAPTGPYAGQLWWKSDEGSLKVYYNSAWVDASTIAGDSSVCQGRLTLTTGVPVTTSDVTGATTIYFTPYKGARIALYDGSSVWTILPFSEVSIALGTLVSATNYDVFAYNNSGTLGLEFSAAWASNTARTDAISLQDGVYVKTGNKTRRYLGTFRTTATTTTEDSLANRFVWNNCNRVARAMQRLETTASWTYGTNAWHQANASAANQLNFICGLAEDALSCELEAFGISASSTQSFYIGIGLDSTTVPSGQVCHMNIISGNGEMASAGFNTVPGLGYHYLAWLELADPATTTTFKSAVTAVGSGPVQSGLVGMMMA